MRHLATGATPLLDPSSVIDDGSRDTLTGGDDADWFLATTSGIAVDRTDAERGEWNGTDRHFGTRR